MFNLSLPELIVIGAAALLVFGPRRLPELAKGLGKGIRDFRKALEGENEEQPPKANADTAELAPGEKQPEVVATPKEEKPKQG